MLTSMKLALFTTLAALSIAGAPGAATTEPDQRCSLPCQLHRGGAGVRAAQM
jgi:hypothetical protein